MTNLYAVLATFSLIFLTALQFQCAAVEDKAARLALLLQQADAQLKVRNNAQAAMLYKSAVRLSSEDSQAHAGLGWALFDQGNHKQGLKEEHTAIQLNPENPLAHHYLGAMLLEAGQMQAAADEYRREYQIDPKRNCHCGPIEALMRQFPALSKEPSKEPFKNPKRDPY